MNGDHFNLSGVDMELAEKVSSGFPEHRTEVLTAVLTALLLRGRQLGEDVSPTRKASRPLAATEFFSRIKPTKDVERVLSAAYFLDSSRQRSEFTVEEIRDCLVEAKVQLPENISLAALRNAKSGLMAQKQKQGRKIVWFITQTGIEKVQAALAGNVPLAGN
jgi:hypothetical protein